MSLPVLPVVSPDGKNVYGKPDPEAQKYFEKTLAFMNEQGATPLLVLTPPPQPSGTR